MATQPDPGPDELPPPDTIEPQSPPEAPPPVTPDEAPIHEPPEVAPVGPDYDQPNRAPPEIPTS